jgi:aspartate-semialdehyde dehydrogenase
MNNYSKLVVIGASGLVGIEFTNIIKNFNLFEFVLVSNTTVGQTCPITKQEYVSLESIDFEKNNVYVNCANSDQAKIIANKMTQNSVLIDNSSEFRLRNDVLLCVPEINFNQFTTEQYNKSNIIANPNCSTIILACLLNPFIKNELKIKRVVVSTYQAASGAGKAGLDELKTQTEEIIMGKQLSRNFWKQQYIFNTFVHDSPIESNGNCQEENKLINETKKIFNAGFGISATCIRVPVLRSHCESVNIEFENAISYNQIYSLLSEEKTIHIIDDKPGHNFPTSITSNNQNLVQVGHIRSDSSLEDGYGWNFWISGDQLLRGAAFNAFEILAKITGSK